VNGPLGGAVAAPLTRFPLWLANYRNTPPDPSPWSAWAFWQHTDRLSVPGVHGACDDSIAAGGFCVAPGGARAPVSGQEEIILGLDCPACAIVPTHTGAGYWIACEDGGVFSYGDAIFFGSMGGHHLDAPVVAMAVTPSGGGYWLIGGDGGVFAFGDAHPFGDNPVPGQHLNSHIRHATPTPSGLGLFLVGGDGGVFTLGDAEFHGTPVVTPQ
jgi:hypothetical protein